MKKLFQLIAAVLIFGWASLTFGQKAVCPFGSVSVAPLQGFQQNPPLIQQNACVDTVTGLLNFPFISIPIASVIPPTGTGYAHITAGAWDAASKLVNLTASTDVEANQGTTTTVLHGNAAGNPSFAVVTPSDAAGNTSGSGSFALTTSPVFVTPTLGAATGTSLNLGATGVLSTTAQSGTGSLCMTTNCVMTTPNIGDATGGTINAAAYNISTHGDRKIVLSNPDFEGSSLIPPPGWTPTASVTVSYETVSPAPDKTQSIKLATTVQNAAIVSSTSFSVVPGDTYSIRAMAKADGSSTATMFLVFRDKNNVSTSLISASTASVSWTPITAIGTVSANSVFAQVNIQNESAIQPSTVWFDRIIVEKLNHPAFISDSANPAAAGVIRIASGDTINFRNNANTADLTIAKTGATSGLILADTINLGSFAGALLAGPIWGVNSIAVDATHPISIPAVTDTMALLAAAQTLSVKRITPRQVSMADATSVTPTSDTADINTFVSTQAGGTLTVNAPSGTPTDGQKLILRLKSTNAQTYSFDATYAFSATTVAPTTLGAGKTDYIGAMWNATNTKWDVVAVDQSH